MRPHPGDVIRHGWVGAEFPEAGVDLSTVVGAVGRDLEERLAEGGMGDVETQVATDLLSPW